MRRISVPLLSWAIRWLGVFAVAAVIFYFSLLDTVSALPVTGPWWDQQLHMVAYTALALATVYATARWRDDSFGRYLAILLVILAYGVVIEFTQVLFPGRHCSLIDMFANTVGTLIAVLWFGAERYVRYQRVEILKLGFDVQ